MENPGLTKEIIDVKTAYLSGKPITDRQSAEAAYSVLDQYCIIPDPIQPQMIREYYQHGKDQRKKMNDRPEDYQGFWRHEDVNQYFESKSRAVNQNRSNIEWLRWIKNQLEGDKAIAVDVKINQFLNQTKPVEKIHSKEVEQLMTTFNGKITEV